MIQISTYVFFDIETTGLPWQERNQTKIIEATFLAVLRQDITAAPFGSIPKTRKLTFLLNPKRPIHPEVTSLTGLDNQQLKNSPVFKDKFMSIHSFLSELPKPVCLIAHNGNPFDFKILLAECQDINASLPKNLLCVDSIVGFRKLLKGTSIDYRDLNPIFLENELITDDEDSSEGDWPDLNVSKEEWDEIDELSTSFSDISYESSGTGSGEELKKKNSKFEKERESVIKNVFAKKSKPASDGDYNCYKLGALHKRLLNKEVENAHRAEADCLMLLECVVALKDQFLPWADGACKLLTEIEPLARNFKKSFK